jgi:hypothetical protein
MKGSWRLAVLMAAVMCALTSEVTAQSPFSQPTIADTQARVEAMSRREVAWGAFLAAEYQYTSLAPQIAEALARVDSAPPDERWALTAILLDALIQLRASLPPSAILPHVAAWPVQSVALLSRVPTGDEGPIVTLLSETTEGTRWFSLANILLKRKPPGFAFRVLKGLRLTLTVAVTDATDARGIIPGGFGGGAVADGICQKPAAFPPVAMYSFSGEYDGATVLTSGPITTYYWRELQTRFQFGCSLSSRSGPTSRDLLTYLDALNAPDRSGLKDLNFEQIAWSNPAEYRMAVQRARQRILDRYVALKNDLREKDLLTESESAEVTLQMSVVIDDRRADRRVTLPPIEP